MKHTVILLAEAPDPDAPVTDPDSWPTIVRTGYTSNVRRWLNWVEDVHWDDTWYDHIMIDDTPQLLRRGGKIT